MKSNIYIRTLKRAEHTVFCVDEAQKNYWDPQFNRAVPYSSGQQIKRSILEYMCEYLGEEMSPTTFYTKVKKTKDGHEFDKEGEVLGSGDPSFTDQLLGGWMIAREKGKGKILKRRSPLMFSAMRTLHPLLGGLSKEKATFDRKDRKNSKVVVKDENGEELSEEEIKDFLLNSKSNVSLTSKYLQDQKRATGLFVQDISINLERLFTIGLNDYEPEISDEVKEILIDKGWEEIENAYGKCLLAPLKIREKITEGLVEAIFEWRINTNQSRTFSLMETLSVAISDNANKISNSIRADLSEDKENSAEPIIDNTINDVEIYTTPNARGYIKVNTVDGNALDNAKKALKEKILSYNLNK